MTTDLLQAVTTAIISRLASEGVGQQVAVGDSPVGDLPLLTVKSQPPSPDRLIAVTAYDRDAQPNPRLRNEVVRVQLWIRGAADDPLDPDAVSGHAFDALHGQHHITWGGLSIDRCIHSYGGPMGPDDQHRWERTDNYLVTTQRST